MTRVEFFILLSVWGPVIIGSIAYAKGREAGKREGDNDGK